MVFKFLVLLSFAVRGNAYNNILQLVELFFIKIEVWVTTYNVWEPEKIF